jgi:hypothetical protein
MGFLRRSVGDRLAFGMRPIHVPSGGLGTLSLLLMEGSLLGIEPRHIRLPWPAAAALRKRVIGGKGITGYCGRSSGSGECGKLTPKRAVAVAVRCRSLRGIVGAFGIARCLVMKTIGHRETRLFILILQLLFESRDLGDGRVRGSGGLGGAGAHDARE